MFNVDIFHHEVSIPMLLVESCYSCSFSKIAFKSIVSAIINDPKSAYNNEQKKLIFVDGDTHYLHSTVKSIYDMKKEDEFVYIITLVSDKLAANSTMLRYLSDAVVNKSIKYDRLERLAKKIVVSTPRILSDKVFSDVVGKRLKLSHKENHVLNLLLDGHSPSSISKIMNISVKTVSGYKNKLVERHGARNFNELYISKLRNDFLNNNPDESTS
ncbi:hypothetical protein VL10_14645 [Leclercia adecarboxylata]|nr:hypothetical protein VL10_14645 [Leclercia adecarboxylata]KMN63675.1 hypothetical protein VK95_18420 [Leclercia sp. LK8]